MKRRIKRSDCINKDAFLMMQYATKDGSEFEFLWNSRDGVIPFIITSESGREMFHVDWKGDKFLPKHKLKQGERYFATLTKARAHFLAKRLLEKRWDHPKYPIKKAYEGLSQEEAAFILAKEFYGDGENPTILKHGEDITTYEPPWMKNKVISGNARMGND